MAFGPYDILSAVPNDSLLNVQVRCDRDRGSPNTTLSVALSQGQFGAGVNARRMNRVGLPVDSLGYGLYRDAGRSANWGVTTGLDTLEQAVSFPPGGGSGGTIVTNFTIYGRIPPQQDVAVGAYADSVVITISP